MRIIGGHDYYDNALQFGRDDDVVFVRHKDKREEITDKWGRHALNRLSFPHSFQHQSGSWDMPLCENEVIVAGFSYPYSTVTLRGEQPIIFMDDNAARLYLKSHGYRINSYPDNRVRQKRALTAGERAFMIDNRFTIAVPRVENDKTYFKIDGFDLKSLGLVKQLNPFECFQEIAMWVGGVLPRNPNSMVEITDDNVKAAKHGMDKWSFRRHKDDNKTP